jgi:hypothetical protein
VSQEKGKFSSLSYNKTAREKPSQAVLRSQRKPFKLRVLPGTDQPGRCSVFAIPIKLFALQNLTLSAAASGEPAWFAPLSPRYVGILKQIDVLLSACIQPCAA